MFIFAINGFCFFTFTDDLQQTPGTKLTINDYVTIKVKTSYSLVCLRYAHIHYHTRLVTQK